jgi:hypothetical protein
MSEILAAGGVQMLRMQRVCMRRKQLCEAGSRRAKLGAVSGVEPLLSRLRSPCAEPPGRQDPAGFPPHRASDFENRCFP